MKWRIGVKMLGFEKTYTLPFKFDIPNYTKEFLEKKTFIKPWIKFIKRFIYIHLRSQNSLEIYNILPEHKEILWINISAPSLGVCLIDFGAGVTSYSVFLEEGIVRSGVIPMGGDDITQEIAFAFDTPLEEAKRLKENYGYAKSSVIKDEQFVEFVR